MKSSLIALAGAVALALGLYAVPAAAAIGPSSGLPAGVSTAQSEGGVQLAHGSKRYRSYPWRRWGYYYGHPRRHIHRRPGFYFRYYAPPRHYPRCFYNRYGHWVCRY